MLKKVPHVRNIISQSAILVKRFEEKLGRCVCAWVGVRAPGRDYSLFIFVQGGLQVPLCSFPSTFVRLLHLISQYPEDSLRLTRQRAVFVTELTSEWTLFHKLLQSKNLSRRENPLARERERAVQIVTIENSMSVQHTPQEK